MNEVMSEASITNCDGLLYSKHKKTQSYLVPILNFYISEVFDFVCSCLKQKTASDAD